MVLQHGFLDSPFPVCPVKGWLTLHKTKSHWVLSPTRIMIRPGENGAVIKSSHDDALVLLKHRLMKAGGVEVPQIRRTAKRSYPIERREVISTVFHGSAFRLEW